MNGLPEGWSYIEIGDLCNLVNGRAFKPQEWSETGLPIIRIQNLNNPKAKFNNFTGTLDSKHHVENGDLLFAWSGTPGTSFGAHIWRGGDAALNQHIFKIEFTKHEIDRAFLRYAINQKLDELIGSAQGGVGLRHVTKGVFEQTKIAFPPFAEQIRIAQKIDKLLAQVDTLKARIDAIPALLKCFRQSVLAAVTDGTLTENWRRCSNTSCKWDNVVFSDLLFEFRGGVSQKPSDLMEGIPVVRSSAVRGMSIDFSDVRHFDKKMELHDRNFIRAGDLLFTRLSGSPEFVGICALVKRSPEKPTQFPDRLFCARLIDQSHAPYLEIFFAAKKYLNYIRDNLKSSAGHQRITTETVKNTLILLPPLEEQTEIVRRVEQLFAFADQLEAKVAAAKIRIDHLTQSILAKAFRGELVPQDPNDEPASVLLERIKAQRAAAPKAKRGSRTTKSN